MTLTPDYLYGKSAIYQAEARVLRDRVKALEDTLRDARHYMFVDFSLGGQAALVIRQRIDALLDKP